MVLVFGGAYNGKLDFVKEKFSINEDDIFYCGVNEIDFSKKDCIKVKEYTEGNRVKTIQIGNLELSGVEVRNILSLRSANFKFSIEGDNIKFEVIGYGHGVGMSQTGADSLAKQGKNFEEIIKHYYTGVDIVDM